MHDDWLEPVPSLKLVIDQDRARALGVTSQRVRQIAAGDAVRLPIGEFRDGDETVKVDAARAVASTRDLLSALDNVYVKTDSGGFGAAAPGRQRRSWCSSRASNGAATGCRRSPCAAPCPMTCSRNDVANAVFAKLKPLRDALPAGYRIEMQGAVEECGQEPGLDQRQDAGHAAGHPACC